MNNSPFTLNGCVNSAPSHVSQRMDGSLKQATQLYNRPYISAHRRIIFRLTRVNDRSCRRMALVPTHQINRPFSWGKFPNRTSGVPSGSVTLNASSEFSRLSVSSWRKSPVMTDNSRLSSGRISRMNRSMNSGSRFRQRSILYPCTTECHRPYDC